MLDKEMKRLCYLGILKEGFSAHSSPLMLIIRKMMQDKRVVTDFRNLNMHIAKNNLAYPLLKDTFTLLGSSRCEVLSVLDLKATFSFSKTDRKFKKVLWNSAFWKCILLISKDVYGFEHFPSNLTVLHQCNCNATMDDLVLFIPTKTSHFAKLEDLLKALYKNGLKISPKKCQLFKTELQYMGNTIFIKHNRVCVKPLRNRIEAIQKLKTPYNDKRL